jgi:hypothetical protein
MCVCDEEIRKHSKMQSPFSISLANSVSVTLVSLLPQKKREKIQVR